jgi:lipid A 3-O-deacylase|tara:strand:+ start:391 stop:888 length:498 start_codon:yes stop_codon:yes gene_type:complete
MKSFFVFLILLFFCSQLQAGEENKNLSFYTGKFDILDDVGDDKTELFGVEHRNPNLFRNTFVGKLAPLSGMFITGKGAAYVYTGVEAQYKIGFLEIAPSFSPGYYEKGNGKNLGDVLEFKSELKVGLDIFKDSNIGYTYSHISNNDWGSVNPGSDNQSLMFSKKF